MSQPAYRCGMTLVEVMMTVVIIGMLAAILIPSVNMAIRGRQNAECARKLHAAAEAFALYRSEVGSYPADRNPGIIPPEMAAYYFPYYKISWWTSATDLGGLWDWDELKYSATWGGHSPIISISLSNPTADTEQMRDLDGLVDDGNLSDGRFIQIGTQYHYILED